MSQDKKGGGWIKLYRELIDKPIWVNGTPEQNRILITLLCMANHAPQKWEWKGKPYEVQPGQFITSLPSIVKKCNCKDVTAQKVRTALKRFEELEFLTNESTNKNRLITIVNWGKYQDFSIADNRQNNRQITGKQQADNRQITSNKNIKNNKNNKNIKNNKNKDLYSAPAATASAPKYTDSFEIFWSAYPKKVGKGAAFKSFQRINPGNELLNKMLAAIDAAKPTTQWQDENGRFIPNPTTWLNQRRWEDEFAPSAYIEPKSKAAVEAERRQNELEKAINKLKNEGWQ